MRAIYTQQLEIAFERIISKLKAEGVTEVIFTNDLYRIIPTDQWQVYKDKNDEVEMGSLYDDLDNIVKLVNDKERPCMYVDFDRIASILRMISEVQNPPE